MARKRKLSRRLSTLAAVNIETLERLRVRISEDCRGVLSSARGEIDSKITRIREPVDYRSLEDSIALEGSGKLYRAVLDCEQAIEVLQDVVKQLRSYSTEPAWNFGDDDDDDDDRRRPNMPSPTPTPQGAH